MYVHVCIFFYIYYSTSRSVNNVDFFEQLCVNDGCLELVQESVTKGMQTLKGQVLDSYQGVALDVLALLSVHHCYEFVRCWLGADMHP